jgi:hypothetical protein
MEYSRDGNEHPTSWVQAIFSPVGLPKSDTGIFRHGFEFQVAPTGDTLVARNLSNIKYILGNQNRESTGVGPFSPLAGRFAQI